MNKINSDKIFKIINYTILSLVLAIFMYPIWFVLVASISDPTFVNTGEVLFLPKGINVEGYKKILEYSEVLTGYKNTIIYTFVGTCINLAVLIPASFALSRKELFLRRFWMIFFLITMYFSGGLIPLYLQVKNLNLMDSMWALILPGAFSVYNMIICRNFFESNVSEELFESAKIDGATYTRFFFSIVLPLSKSIIAVMVLFHALAHWNTYLNALYYIQSKDKYPLQLVLKNLTAQLELISTGESLVDSQSLNESIRLQESVKYSVIVVASIPVLILYPFVQKHFVKGVMLGSVKG